MTSSRSFGQKFVSSLLLKICCKVIVAPGTIKVVAYQYIYYITSFQANFASEKRLIFLLITFFDGEDGPESGVC